MLTSQVKSSKKHPWKIVICILILFLILIVCGAGILFRDELQIAGSIQKVADGKNIYYMEVNDDYHFEEFLKSGGASSDKEVSAFLTKCISKGFYSVNVKEEGPACSVISAKASDGSHIWGRNFDWYGSVPIIVKCIPKDGYSSIASCDFQNITDSSVALPESFLNKMLTIAALYVPMDGINEAGLCVADLEVNEGGMLDVDTDKPDLTVTTAIRLLLNHAATVDEAIALLEQYDIHASGGISHHIAISDAAGASVVIEFVDGKMIPVDSNCITNFNLANGDTSAGGENAQERYESLCSVYETDKGILTSDQVKAALSQVSQSKGKWTTQWSIVYEQSSLSVSYYFNNDYNQAYIYTLSK